MLVKLDHFPRDRDEHKTHIWNHYLSHPGGDETRLREIQHPWIGWLFQRIPRSLTCWRDHILISKLSLPCFFLGSFIRYPKYLDLSKRAFLRTPCYTGSFPRNHWRVQLLLRVARFFHRFFSCWTCDTSPGFCLPPMSKHVRGTVLDPVPPI